MWAMQFKPLFFINIITIFQFHKICHILSPWELKGIKMTFHLWLMMNITSLTVINWLYGKYQMYTVLHTKHHNFHNISWGTTTWLKLSLDGVPFTKTNLLYPVFPYSHVTSKYPPIFKCYWCPFDLHIDWMFSKQLFVIYIYI